MIDTEVKPFSIEELTEILETISHRVNAAEKVIADKKTNLEAAKSRLEQLEKETSEMEAKQAKDMKELTRYQRFLATLLAQKEEHEAEQKDLEELRHEEVKQLLLQLKVQDGGIAAADIDRIAECIGIDASTGFKEEEKKE